ncbi:MAG: hypothetical protein ACLSAH_21875 [Bilophila wadsworthia]
MPSAMPVVTSGAQKLVAGAEHAHELLAVAGLDGDHGDSRAS